MTKYIKRLFVQLSFYLKINRYLCKCFLLNFIKIYFAFFVIIFFLNFIDGIDNSSIKVSLFTSMSIAALKVPDFLNSISPSLILFTSLATFYSLSNRSEITIIRCSGYSMWHLVSPLVIMSFIIGIFWITIYNNASVYSYRLASKMQSQIYTSNTREVIKPKTGIWIKQDNPEFENGYMLIKSKMLYKNNIEMISNSLWFFDDKYEYYKKIDSKKMFLRDGFWEIPIAIVNTKKDLNKTALNLTIKSNLNYDIFSEKFLNNLEDPRLFSVFSIARVIADLNELGLSSTKFKIQLNYLISLPILFSIMVLISSFFGINSFRDRRAVMKLALGLATGLVIYILISFIKALGASKLIPVFVATWLVVLTCFAFSIIAIYKKEGQ